VSHSTVHLDTEVEAELAAQSGKAGDFVDGEGQELLSSEARIDAHYEHEVDHGEDFDERLDRCSGIDDDAREDVVFGDVLQGAVQVGACLLMHRDHICAGLGEGWNVRVWILDHEVAVEGELGDGAQRLDHRRAEGNVGNEVAVHDIDVNDGSAATFGCGDFIGEMGKVGGEDGEGEFDHGSEVPGTRFKVKGCWGKCISTTADEAAIRS